MVAQPTGSVNQKAGRSLTEAVGAGAASRRAQMDLDSVVPPQLGSEGIGPPSIDAASHLRRRSAPPFEIRARVSHERDLSWRWRVL